MALTVVVVGDGQIVVSAVALQLCPVYVDPVEASIWVSFVMPFVDASAVSVAVVVVAISVSVV
jgi:hypothetical protein